MLYQVAIRHNPEYFNTRCMATIPENWQADVLDEVKTKHNTNLHIYGIGDTRQQCIDDLTNQLREMGLSGHLRIVSDDK